MVTCILKARLGNQMYIIAATVAYAIKHRLEYHIPIHSTQDTIWPVRFTNLQNKSFDKRLPKIYVNDGKHSYTELPFKEEWRKMNIFIGTESIETGYFQNEKYFEGLEEQVIPVFGFPYEGLPGFVGIHVRRGDYLNFQDEFPPTPIDYYERAINMFLLKGYRSFIVCSDDIRWCRVMFKKFEVKGVAFTFSEGHSDKEDMVLLSCCEHFIGSNSTFSTWAYILNQNSNKIGTFPTVWFGPKNSHLDSSGIYPKGSIKM
jgi:hypothetical protein